jgi:lipopolysaccharide biosynthesis regulator YciM
MKTFLLLFLSVLSLTFIPAEKELNIDAFSSETVINIQLNDGEKWNADPETTASIKALQEICTRHWNEKAIDDEALKEALTAEVNNLNRITKLTGNARSQLHNYQMGIRNRINVISQDRESLRWLMDYLETYYTYFD